MLRLNRKVGESIIIETPDGQIAEIVVTGFSRAQVQLGIQAPRGIAVWREELYGLVKQNRESVTQTASTQQIAQQLHKASEPNEQE